MPAYGTTCWVKSFPKNHMKPWEMSVLDARNLKGFYGFKSLLWREKKETLSLAREVCILGDMPNSKLM
jgi:hypothetical protein